MFSFLRNLFKPKLETPWSFEFSRGMSAGPKKGVFGPYFSFPSGNGSVHYLTRPWTKPINFHIRVKYQIDGLNPEWTAKLKPDNTGNMPPLVCLWVQRKGDDMTGKGKMQYYRWWAIGEYEPLSPGVFEIKADVKYIEDWVSVFGDRTNLAQFQACLKNPQKVGMTFGGGSFLGHGIRLTKGSATFTILEFEVV